MRIHSNTLTRWQVYEAIQSERLAGRVASHVALKRLTGHRSQSHTRAFEIQLEAFAPDNGRRVGNSGSYGAMNDGTWAATYDEWGWLLAALYRLDPSMVVGSVKHPVYDGRTDFDRQTGLSFNPTKLARLIDNGADPYPWVVGTGNRPGRMGYGRRDDDGIWLRPGEREQAIAAFEAGTKQGNRFVKYLPRTIEQVATFAHLDVHALRVAEAVTR